MIKFTKIRRNRHHNQITMDKIQTTLDQVLTLISSFKEGDWAWTNQEIFELVPDLNALTQARIKKWDNTKPAIASKDNLAIRKLLYLITGREEILTQPPSKWGLLDIDDLDIHYKVLYICTKPKIGFDCDAEAIVKRICDLRTDNNSIQEIQRYLKVGLPHIQKENIAKLRRPHTRTTTPEETKNMDQSIKQILEFRKRNPEATPSTSTPTCRHKSKSPQYLTHKTLTVDIETEDFEDKDTSYHEDLLDQSYESGTRSENSEGLQHGMRIQGKLSSDNPDCKAKNRPFNGYETALEEFIYCTARPAETLSYRTELRTIHGLIMSNHLHVSILNKMIQDKKSSESIWNIIDKEVLIPDTMALICQIGEASVKMSQMYQHLMGHVASQLTKELASNFTIPASQQDFITKSIKELKEVITEERAQRLATGQEVYKNPKEPEFILPPPQTLRVNLPPEQPRQGLTQGLVFDDDN